MFLGAFAACGSYAVWLLFRNFDVAQFCRSRRRTQSAAGGRDGRLALRHAVFLRYRRHYLGKLGTSVGYASMMSCSLLVANLMGFMTNEWKGAGRQAHGWLYKGLALLMLGIVALTIGNNLHEVTRL